MRRRSKQVFCFISCFLLSFFILLYITTLYRETSYDSLVQSFELSEEKRYQAMDKAREQEREDLTNADPPLDEIFNEPVMIEYVAKANANATKFQFDLCYDLVPRICERESSVFPLRFFHVYGKMYSFENLQHVALVGMIDAYDMGPYSHGDSGFNDLGEVILAWESQGNTREGEWLDKFLSSPEYEVFVQDLYAEIESIEGKSLDNIMGEIFEVSTDFHGPLNEFKTPFLKDAQELAAVVYEDYQEDMKIKDISRVTFEARILQRLHERVLWFEESTPYQCRSLRWARPFLPDPFVDLAGIFACSMVISLVTTYFVSKKYWY
jgi:hypothetical protein